MTRVALILLLVVSASLIGCASPPAAQFTAVPATGCAPIEVQFTDLSEGKIDTWEWDFDNDGLVDSNIQSPQYTYSEPGIYTVSLTVSGPGGSDSEIKMAYLDIAPASCEADFFAEPTTGYVPIEVQITDLSKGEIDTWEWDFDNDGLVDSNVQNPQYTYSEPGVYTVSLKVSGPGGAYDSETRIAYLEFATPCKADFIAEPTVGRGVTKVQFSDQSTGEITSWAWDVNGDGDTDSTEQNPTHVYRRNGLYSVTLTIAGPYCEDTLTKTHYIEITGCPT